MLLSNIVIPKLAHKKFKFYSPDTQSDCQDLKHFKKYPYDITYEFNSRGFRDNEWPNDLANAIWCLGDSATVGVGAPMAHSWPSQLAILTGMPTINLGIRAIDNYTISDIAGEIITNLQPRNVLILWSFFERRPVSNIHTEIVDLSEQLVVENDLDHYDYFTKCILNLKGKNSKTNIIHGLVPNSTDFIWNDECVIRRIWDDVKDPSWPEKIENIENIDTIDSRILDELNTVHHVYDRLKRISDWYKFKNEFMKNEIGKFDQLDLARDGRHWDITTSKSIANKFKTLLKENK